MGTMQKELMAKWSGKCEVTREEFETEIRKVFKGRVFITPDDEGNILTLEEYIAYDYDNRQYDPRHSGVVDSPCESLECFIQDAFAY